MSVGAVTGEKNDTNGFNRKVFLVMQGKCNAGYYP